MILINKIYPELNLKSISINNISYTYLHKTVFMQNICIL